MSFEKFSRRKRAGRGGVTVTVLKNGTLGISRRCYEELLGGQKYAILYYDRDRRIIGIQPTNKEDEEAYPIRTLKNTKSVVISAAAFLKYFNIPHDVSKAYKVKWNEEAKLLELDLKQ